MSDTDPPFTPPAEDNIAAYFERQLVDILTRQEDDWARGLKTSIDDLARHIAGPCDRRELLLELIHNEIVLREQTGENPSLADYQQRFPELADVLRVQWEMDQLIAGDDSPISESYSIRDGLFPSRLADRYQLQEEIGRGSMGIVYRAWDTELKRVVAIKRLRAGADAEFRDVDRFRQEAESIAQVHHPNIVHIYDFAQLDGLPCLTMEYCPDGSLADQLKGRAMSPRLAAQLTLQIAEGIAAAHQRQIVHRDLKPANVLLAGTLAEPPMSEFPLHDPRHAHSLSTASWSRRRESATSVALPVPKITDFGLAKLLTSDVAATATGSVLGSPAYMAPEQAWGDVKRVGPLADVYAVGAILYECLTGRPPFRGATVSETLTQVRDQQPIGIRQLEPRVPVDLETIALKCLRKDPLQRYPSAKALADDLSRFLRYEPITARRENLREVAARTFRRYPAVSSLAFASLLLLVLIAVGSLLFARQLQVAKLNSERAERAARLGQAEALSGRAHGMRLSRRPGQRFEALAALRQAADIGRNLNQPREWFGPLRDEAIAALALPDAYVEQYRTESEAVAAGDVSDDGLRYVLAFEKGDLLVQRSADYRLVARLPRLDTFLRVQFLGDDRILVCGEPSLAYEVWDVSGAKPQRLWSHCSGCEQFHVSRDEKLLAVADRNDLTICDVDTGTVLAKQPVAPFAREPRIVLHPTAPLVLLHSYFVGECQVRNWRTGETLLRLKPGNDDDYPGYTGADWSPDGKRLIVINGHGEAAYWYDFDAATADAKLTRTDRPAKFAGGGGPVVRFNNTGDRLFVTGWSRQLTLCDGYRGDAILAAEPLRPLSVLEGKKLDPSGRFGGMFASSDQPQRMGRMSLAEGREFHLLTSQIDNDKQPFGHADFDPTGSVVAACTASGLALIATDTGLPLVQTPWRGFHGYHVCFDAVGHLYVSGQAGCLRWPCRVIQGKQMTLELGVPERVHLVRGGNIYLASSDDGSVLSAGAWNGFGSQEYAGCWIKSDDEPAARKVVGHCSGTLTAVSPDGQWIFLSSDAGSTLVRARAPTIVVKKFSAANTPRFSRDGNWLLADGACIRMKSWKASPIENGAGTPFDLSSDGSQIVTCTSAGALGLVEAASGRPFARFEGPEPCGAPQFSPDGSRILCKVGSAYYLFELSPIRAELARMGLDWEAPPLAPVPLPRVAGRPLPWKIVMASELKDIDSAESLLELLDRRALQRAEQNSEDGQLAFGAAKAAIENSDLTRALDLLDRACARLPNSVTARQWRAYVLAEQRDFSAAIDDADWVLQRIDEDDFRLLRAEWLLRAGRHPEAISACDHVIDSGSSLARFAYGLRGKAYEALGDTDRASADQGKFLALTRNDPASLDMTARPMVATDISLRHPTVAMLIANKLRALTTDYDRSTVNTIGLMLYRNDRFHEVVQWLETYATRSEGLTAADWYVLAMAHQKLGQPERARDCLDRGVGQPAERDPFDPISSMAFLRKEAARCVAGRVDDESPRVMPISRQKRR